MITITKVGSWVEIDTGDGSPLLVESKGNGKVDPNLTDPENPTFNIQIGSYFSKEGILLADLNIAGVVPETYDEFKTQWALVFPDANSGSGGTGLEAVEHDNSLTGDGSAGDPLSVVKTKRIGTTASSATPTPNADAHDQYNVTALAVDATFGAPTGTPTDGQELVIRIKDNGTARALAWNAAYRGSTDFDLPDTTEISKTIYLYFVYNAADVKWDATGLTQGF